MLFIPVERATLLICSGPSNDPNRKHLFIILTNPISINGCTEKSVLLVSVCSVSNDRYYDKTCLLSIGDHEFIKHESYINYGMARVESLKKIDKGVRQGQFIQKENVSVDLFKRISDGLLISSHTPIEIIEFFEYAITLKN